LEPAKTNKHLFVSIQFSARILLILVPIQETFSPVHLEPFGWILLEISIVHGHGKTPRGKRGLEDI
jgi:hypothetical protein